MPSISVIVPVYRVEPFLHRCVDSILGQTLADFELILVDDGSPDRCGAICDEYAERDSRIHVIHQENGGLSAARNAGIDWVFANSDSCWFTFIDSDDWVHPQLLQRLLDAAVGGNVKISVCGYGETAGEDPVVSLDAMEPQVWDAEAFYLQHMVNATVAWGKLYSRECFQAVRYPAGKIHEDEYVTYRLLFGCGKLAWVPAPLYAYYVNPEGITRKPWSSRRLDAWEAYEQQLAFFENLGNREMHRFRCREYLQNSYTQLCTAQSAPNAQDLKKEIRYIKKAMRNLIRRAWKWGYIHFWIDFDMLYACTPVRTKLYRLYLEFRKP